MLVDGESTIPWPAPAEFSSSSPTRRRSSILVPDSRTLDAFIGLVKEAVCIDQKISEEESKSLYIESIYGKYGLEEYTHFPQRLWVELDVFFGFLDNPECTGAAVIQGSSFSGGPRALENKWTDISSCMDELVDARVGNFNGVYFDSGKIACYL